MDLRFAPCPVWSATPIGFARLGKITAGLPLTRKQLDFEEGKTCGGNHQAFFSCGYVGPWCLRMLARGISIVVGQSLLVLVIELRKALRAYFLDLHKRCFLLPSHIRHGLITFAGP